MKKTTFYLIFSCVIIVLPKLSNGQCCAAGNPVSADGTSSQGKGILKISALYQHSFSDTYFEGNQASDFVYKNTFYDFNSLKFAYGLGEKLNLDGEIGYYINKSEYFVLTDFSRFSKGFGDASLTLRYSIFKSTEKQFEIAPLFTLKIPVGEFDQIYNNVLLPIDLQPSSGSFRFKPGFIVYKGIDHTKLSFFTLMSAEFAQAIKTERTFNYKYGNLYMVSLFASYQFSEWLNTSLEIREQYSDMANNNGLDIKATGGNVLSLVPRITAFYKDWEFGANYNQPLLKNLNSIGYPQLSSKYAFSLSVGRKIDFLKSKVNTPFVLDDLAYETDSFYVNGICNMCRDRIVSTTMKNKRIKWADWNSERKMLVVKYLGEIDRDQLMKSLSDAGHDNQSYKATEKKYAKLHACCRYR